MAMPTAETHHASYTDRAEGRTGQVTRQPILDRRYRVHGYELRFRSDPKLSTISELAGGLQLAGGLPAFLRCTADSLGEDWVQGLPPLSVMELPADTELTPRVLEAVQKLKALNMRLALRDCGVSVNSLYRLADYVKVDMARRSAPERRSLLRMLNGSAQMIAEQVETLEDYEQARDEGFTLFQGYFFCHPKPLANKRIPGNRLVQLEILETLQQDPVDLERLSQLVKCDASLTYFLLRLLNSPACAMRQEVTSIQTAMLLLGIAAFRRIAIMAIASDFNSDQPAEVLRMAFERGRFCELAGGHCGLLPSEQYLIGMVSMFPVMLRIPVEDLVRSLPLGEKARNALLGREDSGLYLLRWMVCHERADWAGCDEVARSSGLSQGKLMGCYLEAVAWADQALLSKA
jgi:EAL and modified HD-GYP domain-containing signal transduction protein